MDLPNGNCQHVLNKIQSHSGACLIIHEGPLQDALEYARQTERSKPVLIYIHHDQRAAYVFVKVLVEFLNENYIVCFWNVTNEINRQRFIQQWNDIFIEKIEIDFSERQCPMLIAINRRFSMATNPPSIYYQTNRIPVCNGQPSTADIELLISRLISFKEDFDSYEKFLKSKFFENIVCLRELVLTLCEYSPLNDALTLFPSDIIQELIRYKIKTVVEYPTEEFVQNMKTSNVEHIECVRVKAEQCKKIFASTTSNPFTHVIKLIIEDFDKREQISRMNMKNYFPMLNRLVLYSTQSIDLRKFSNIFTLLPSTTKELHIHGSTILCSHRHSSPFFVASKSPDKSIEIFRLVLTPQSNTNYCDNFLDKCILNTLAEFIRIMHNIQRISISISTNLLELFINSDEWVKLVSDCSQLNQITIHTQEKITLDTDTQGRINDIQNNLRTVRGMISFEINMA